MGLASSRLLPPRSIAEPQFLGPQPCEYATFSDTLARFDKVSRVANSSRMLTARGCWPGRPESSNDARWTSVGAAPPAEIFRLENRLLKLPPGSGVRDYYNVILTSSGLHAHLSPSDIVGVQRLAEWNNSLPAEALASNVKAFPNRAPVTVHRHAAQCAVWRSATVFFMAPAAGMISPSIWHQYADFILPVVQAMRARAADGRTQQRLYLVQGPGANRMNGAHWRAFLDAVGGALPAGALLGGHERMCFSHLVWGSGFKSLYAVGQIPRLRDDMHALRGMILGAARLQEMEADARRQQLGSPHRVYVSRTGYRSLSNVKEALAWLHVDETCCDFRAPLSQQIARLSRASVVLGLHGANLMNMIYARPGAVLVEFKGSYALDRSDMYRRVAQSIGGGYVSLRVQEFGSAKRVSDKMSPGHRVTEAVAASANACIAALHADAKGNYKGGGAEECRAQRYVIEAAAVGSVWDCFPAHAACAKATPHECGAVPVCAKLSESVRQFVE